MADVEADFHFAMTPEWVLYHEALSSTAVRVFGTLHRHVGMPGGVFPSHERVAKLLSISERTVQRSLDELRSVGAITVESRFTDAKRQQSNRYLLHMTGPRQASEAEVPTSASRRVDISDTPPPSLLSTREVDTDVHLTIEREEREKENESTRVGGGAGDAFGRALSAWEGVAGLASRPTADKIEAAVEVLPEEWVLEAIAMTGLAGTRSWNYTQAILDRWQRDGRGGSERQQPTTYAERNTKYIGGRVSPEPDLSDEAWAARSAAFRGGF